MVADPSEQPVVLFIADGFKPFVGFRTRAGVFHFDVSGEMLEPGVLLRSVMDMPVVPATRFEGHIGHRQGAFAGIGQVHRNDGIEGVVQD